MSTRWTAAAFAACVALATGAPAQASDDADATVTVDHVVYTCMSDHAAATGWDGPTGQVATIASRVACPGGELDVTEIGDNAFYPTGIDGVVIPPTVSSIGEGAFFSSGMTSVTIPGTVRTIEYGAFAVTPQLRTVVLEEGTRVIGRIAFDGSRVSMFTIPASVTELGSGALGSNTLSHVVMAGPPPALPGGDPFVSSLFEVGAPARPHVNVEVPAEYLDDYLAAGWNDFPGVTVVEPWEPGSGDEEPRDDPDVSAGDSPTPTPAMEPSPSVTPAVSSAPAGTAVGLMGEGFAPLTPIAIRDNAGDDVASAVTDDDGAFSVQMRLSDDLSAGIHLYTAWSGDEEDAAFVLTVSAPVTEDGGAASPEPSGSDAEPSPMAQSPEDGGRDGVPVWPWAAGGLVVLAGAGGGAWWLHKRPSAS